jgi:hypothetical protein
VQVLNSALAQSAQAAQTGEEDSEEGGGSTPPKTTFLDRIIAMDEILSERKPEEAERQQASGGESEGEAAESHMSVLGAF